MAMVVPKGSHGAYREQIVLDARAVVPAPAGTTHVEACTLPMNGLTARQSLDLLGLSAGQTLAVTGAAGAYGGYVVQLAKAEGLTVIADASEADHALVASLGADIVVRRGDDVATRILEHFPTRRRRSRRRCGPQRTGDSCCPRRWRVHVGAWFHRRSPNGASGSRRPRCVRTTASSRNWTASGNSWSLEPSPSVWPTPTHRSAPVMPTDGWRRVAREDGSSSSSNPEEAASVSPAQRQPRARWHTSPVCTNQGALPCQTRVACAVRSVSVPQPLTPRSPCAPGVQSAHHPDPG